MLKLAAYKGSRLGCRRVWSIAYLRSQLAMFAAIRWALWLSQCGLLPLVYSTSIAEIQGHAFQSPFNGLTVTGVAGVVTAKV